VEYGTPNDWIETSPTAKAYQKSADEFFKGIGNWGYEKGTSWFPSLYAPSAQQRQQQGQEGASEDA